MKLRNKKTGGLASVEIIVMDEEKDDYFRVYTDAGNVDYNTLAELNAEWEDYQELKRPIEERLLNLEIKMAEVEDDIAFLKAKK